MTYSFSRQIAIKSGYDLVVAGGGPGGCGAAISAAEQGLKVLLVESTNALGGMGTGALVSAWSHMSNGRETMLGGLMLRLVEEMYDRGFIASSYDQTFWTTIHNRGLGYAPEGLKLVLDEWCQGAGVDLLFMSRVVDAEVDDADRVVKGVVIATIEGMKYVPARAFVDATGDAVLSDLVGAACFRAGRDSPNINPPTMCSVQGGIDHSVFNRREQQPFVDQAVDDGFFSQPDRHVPGLFPSGKSSATLNAGHLFHTDALDARSLSNAMVWGRQLAHEYTRFCREYLPGCQDIELLSTGALLGVRESRRVIGEYELDYDDYIARRHFPDQIAIYCKQVDIHVYDTSDEQYDRYKEEFLKNEVLEPGESYGITYGILVPRGWQNLWVAGRSNSSDVKVSAAIRDQPCAYMMGEAAGCAAAQALERDETAVGLDTGILRATLSGRGAKLEPQAA